MEYRKLGRSGLMVSSLSYGSWITLDSQSATAQKLCMHIAYDAGVNFFDNAEAYSNGESEVVMGQILKDQKETNRKISYEDISTDLENNPNFSYNIENETIDSENIISEYLLALEKILGNKNMNENELKLGQALYELFENYDKIFLGTNNNKFNKNIVLLSLREMTNLNTKEIRSSLKKFKMIYVDVVEKLIK
jgi:diketogulonate reductase-like aldo/keto reductase